MIPKIFNIGGNEVTKMRIDRNTIAIFIMNIKNHGETTVVARSSIGRVTIPTPKPKELAVLAKLANRQQKKKKCKEKKR